MEKNCIVTTLKKSINNDVLPLIGAIRCKFLTDVYGDIYVSGVAGNDVILKVITDGVNINSVSGDNGAKIDNKTARLADYTSDLSQSVRFDSANTEVECIIENKYNLVELIYVYDMIDRPTYLLELKTFRTRQYSSDSNIIYISELEKSSKLTTLDALTDKIVGNIKELAYFEDLNTLYLIGATQVFGCVEDFVALRKVSGYTSGSVIAHLSGSSVTFNDATCGNSTIAWSASGDNTVITFNSVSTTIHVNADGTWSRVS